MSFFFVRTFRCYDSHHHFVKLFVFICGDMNGVTPWLRAIFVSVYHKESLNNKNAYAKHSGSKSPKVSHLNFPAKNWSHSIFIGNFSNIWIFMAKMVKIARVSNETFWLVFKPLWPIKSQNESKFHFRIRLKNDSNLIWHS